MRRSRRTRELAYYRCYAPGPCRWPAWCTSPGSGGRQKRTSPPARPWPAWTSTGAALDLLVPVGHLGLLALALLTAAAAAEHTRDPRPAGQVPLTRNEIASLLTLAVPPASDTGYRLRWPAWRRRHQHKARASHYERQAAHDPRRRPGGPCMTLPGEVHAVGLASAASQPRSTP